MYRQLLPVFLYISSLAAAPQDVGDSAITYIQHSPAQQPTETNILDTTTNAPREPRTTPEDTVDQDPRVQEDGHTTEGDETVTTTEQPEAASTQPAPHDTHVAPIDTHVAPINTNVTPLVTHVAPLVQPSFIHKPEKKRVKPSFTPRYLSKLSYFKKESAAPSTNLIEGSGKRRFRSKCRCEKIWNCPKLQITVPRCPNEYFMCCF